MDYDSDIQTKVVRVNRTYNVYRGTSPSTQNRLEARIRELEDALDGERDTRLRFEKQCAELTFQLDQMSDRLEEASGMSSSQLDINNDE